MKILMYPRSYGNLTGSELYHYELAREMVKLGHTVVVAGKENTEIGRRTLAVGVDIVHPFRVYDLARQFDVVHTSQYMPTDISITKLQTPVVQTIHSEHPMLSQYESPHPLANAYISIRKSIKRMVPDSTLIYNPIDFSRFNREGVQRPLVKTVLFPGTLDDLREPSAKKLIELSKSEDFDVAFVGHEYVKYPGVTPLPPQWDIEKVMKKCTHVASIMHGRTVFESWACGLPAYVFKINPNGKYISHTVETPPEDMSFCDSKEVAEKTINVYKSIITN